MRSGLENVPADYVLATEACQTSRPFGRAPFGMTALVLCCAQRARWPDWRDVGFGPEASRVAQGGLELGVWRPPIKTLFHPLDALLGEEESGVKKYRCIAFGYIYDPGDGDPSGRIVPGTPFEELPDDWVCPECGVGKDMFELVEE